ncbi:hypothetical protein FGM00_04960 [Aggregatimonas sangjinii]|uniref:Uncharacterized protein n=1 Tax=Aggregatimonas sangjinii TaxID=2583587 RepID=A0A5B7SMY1_9FLAO|nr:hypothetical protein [Aggregatimonas sangjinii]QCW99491.1 hypothetical protein FGM00_04960 [Aggregatimonas sangjinii]
MANVISYRSRRYAVLEAFQEALAYRSLNYTLNGLKRYGFENEQDINLAIKKAMTVCNGLGIDPKKHFGYFYKVDMLNKYVIREWKATKLGFYLVLCNGRSDNPFAGALQIEMLTEFISKLD